MPSITAALATEYFLGGTYQQMNVHFPLFVVERRDSQCPLALCGMNCPCPTVWRKKRSVCGRSGARAALMSLMSHLRSADAASKLHSNRRHIVHARTPRLASPSPLDALLVAPTTLLHSIRRRKDGWIGSKQTAREATEPLRSQKGHSQAQTSDGFIMAL